jgi:branched-chain amino acid transport system permease protein
VEQFLQFTVVGLVTGAVYAIAASGMVVTYATSGIFNFAHGAIAMASAFLFWQLNIGWGLPWPAALILVVGVIAPLFGVLVERVVLRGLEGAPEVARVVVPVGLLFGLLALVPIIWKPRNRNIPPFFGAGKFEDLLGLGVNVTHQDLAIIVLAVVVAGGLRALLYGTRAGVAMRAVVDSRTLARLDGARPGRSSALSWALGCGLAALAGLLISEQLDVLLLTLLVFNAYAAAVVGRLRSLPMTFVGAIVLGLAQAYAVGYMPNNPSWLPDDVDLKTPMITAVPVVMLFIVLLLLPHAPLRTAGVQRSREAVGKPTMRRSMIGMGALVVVTGLGAMTLSDGDAISWGKALGYAIVMLSLVPLTGYAGQISLAQMSFAGLGAYAVATWGGGGNPLGLVAAAVLAAVVGALVALPALRLSGIYLALATFAFAVFMDKVVFNQRALFESGSKSVDRPALGPVSFESNQAYLVLLALMFAVLGLFVVWLRLGPLGRRLQAMKDSPAACATLGMSLTRTKLLVFMISAAIAGIGGAALAGLSEVAQPSQFEVLAGLPVLLLAVAGGIAMVSGSLLGGFFLALFAIVPGWIPEGWEIAGIEARELVENLLLVMPALLGISLGRNPNGAAHEIGSRLRALFGRDRAGTEVGPDPAELLVDVETLGIDHPLTARQAVVLDERLGLDEEVIHAVAAGR